MGLFGMSEQELKKFAEELAKKEVSLKNLESDINLRQENLKHEVELSEAENARLQKDREELAAERSALESRRQEVLRKEAEAKVGFAKAQAETFKEVVEARQTALNMRKEELDKLSASIAERMAEMTDREGLIAKRELSVTEREQQAEAGFAEKATALAAEAKRQHEANLQEANRLKQLADRLAQERRELADEKDVLRQRAKKLADAEITRDAGYATERAAVDVELNGKRAAWQNEDTQKRSALEKELADRKVQMIAEMAKEVSAQREKLFAEIATAAAAERESVISAAQGEAQRIRDEIAAERKTWREEQASREAELKRQSEANAAKRGELSDKEEELIGRQHELQALERRLENEKGEIGKLVEDRIAEYKVSLESENESFRTEIQRLRDSLRTQTGLVGAFEQLKRQLGDKDPADVLRDLDAKTDEIRHLREDLASRPSEEMRERYQALESEVERLKARADQLQAKVAENESTVRQADDLRRRNDELESDNKSLAQRAERWEAAANEAQAELKRRLAAYEPSAEVEARHKKIERPRIGFDEFVRPVRTHDIDEITWLKGVGSACDSYGLHFPERILKAFHTALKTAEWSPLTVLAGVSGTGKSELPRLYSHFGGLLFEPLSVQPNWDSQESMLGFFNSIDNEFDAQPVLRFLAQSQKEFSDQYPGLEDCVCMVLLDEMNLAHPELYFAEFLSKLELRRGTKGVDHVPKLPVKIGAGLFYQLPLGRNVLWTGTMNQDETTKSLSDKVLDRSIVIHFPRPTKLARREKLLPLDEKNRSPLLHRKTFENWWAKESEFNGEQIRPYREFVEKINDALGVAGRAIGHRVWQSVEYYMANYPDVRAALHGGGDEAALRNAMHIAFEDQLVQKVMPKLRGIDTRGKMLTDCLEKIQNQLNSGIRGNPFNLDEDFKLACELGHGQFIWQSANYLREDASTVVAIGGDINDQPADDAPTIAGDVEATPDGFRPGNPKRSQYWARKSPEQREQWLRDFENHQS